MSDIHIYVQDAFFEARNLRMQAEELAQESSRLSEQAEELGSVWRGASARRVQEAMVGRSKDAEKIANNLGVISDGLRQTAETYQRAQQPGGKAQGAIAPGAKSIGVKPGIKVNVNIVTARSAVGGGGW